MIWRTRVRIANVLMYAGLFFMPDGKYKARLTDRLWVLHTEVMRVVGRN